MAKRVDYSQLSKSCKIPQVTSSSTKSIKKRQKNLLETVSERVKSNFRGKQLQFKNIAGTSVKFRQSKFPAVRFPRVV